MKEPSKKNRAAVLRHTALGTKDMIREKDGLPPENSPEMQRIEEELGMGPEEIIDEARDILSG